MINPNRKEELNGEIRNIHTLFRKDFLLSQSSIKKAYLYITADDSYKLYINGEFIGIGPAPAYPFDFPYNAWDVTDYLHSGVKNCIGVHTFYQGMHSLTFPSGDNLQGLILQIDLEYDTGDVSKIISDQSWKCFTTEAYHSNHVLGYQTAFSEDIDLRKIPIGWLECNFNDSSWSSPLASDIPEIYNLSPQVTPPVSVFKRSPEKLIKKGEGHFFIDFGSELSGETVFVLSGNAGHKVEIRHGEELSEPETVRYDMRCNCLYQEFCTLSGKKDEYLTFFDYKGFRYVEVINWPEDLTPGRVWAHERHYPFPESASYFESSNHLLNRIWELCRNGVRVGTIDTFLDCPTREKGGFMGDGFITGISHLILTGDPRIMRKFLKDVANTQRYCQGLLSTAPNYINGELAEYSLLWPVLLEYYYQWTEDVDFLNEMMTVLERMLEYYAKYENDDGLLEDVFSHTTGRYSVLVDWPKNLRDGYDDPFLMGDRKIDSDPEGVINTMVQGFYYKALKTSEKLAIITGREKLSKELGIHRKKLNSAIKGQLRDTETGLFVDRNKSDHSALHANVTPLMSGSLSFEERKPVVELIKQKRLNCGVYFSYFVLKALYDVGESQLAYDLMTSEDLHSWHSMLKAGATTCMEAWTPELKWNTSWCHPWSSAPIHIITHELMGLKPEKPGWKVIRFSPEPPMNLESASISIYTPGGEIKARFKQEEDTIEYKLTIPKGCSAKCILPEKINKVSVDNIETPYSTIFNDNGIICNKLEKSILEGEHFILVFKNKD